jgi:type IV pilus assembly protein PilM
MFKRQSLGLEISRDGLKMVVLGGKRTAPKLISFSANRFPDETVRFSFKEPNVTNPAHFVRTIRENHLKLLTTSARVSVSLPDSVGRAMILDLDTRFKSKQEGAEIIRWKLKKGFPLDIDSIHIDYQVLRESESGGMMTLVSAITKEIINQYEDLLVEAGLEPNRIDFTTFNLYRLFSDRLEISENSAFLTYFGGILSITVFYEGILEFFRAKELAMGTFNAERIFREINSSLAVYRSNHPGHLFNEVFYAAPLHAVSDFSTLIAEATGIEPFRLQAGDFLTGSNGLFCNGETLQSLSPAIGAAKRNL